MANNSNFPPSGVVNNENMNLDSQSDIHIPTPTGQCSDYKAVDNSMDAMVENFKCYSSRDMMRLLLKIVNIASERLDDTDIIDLSNGVQLMCTKRENQGLVTSGSAKKKRKSDVVETSNRFELLSDAEMESDTEENNTGEHLSARNSAFPPLTPTSEIPSKPQPPKPLPFKTQTSIPKQNKTGASAPRPVTPKPTSDIPKIPKPEKVPPITLSDKSLYQPLLKAVKEQNIQVLQYSDSAKGLRVFPKTPTDHRKIQKILDENDIKHFTHQLPEDKTLRVVVRGVVGIISTKELGDELTDLGFDIVSIAQMHRKDKDGQKVMLPLALVQLVKNDKNKNIYNLKHICQIRCRIEPQRSSAQVSQCHRCQLFGHTQSKCKLSPRCVKCLGSHLSKECKKSDSTPPLCVNCGKGHPANYRGCEAFPKLRTNNGANPTPKIINKPSKVQPNKSYASATAKPTGNNKDKLFEQISTLLRQLIFSNE